MQSKLSPLIIAALAQKVVAVARERQRLGTHTWREKQRKLGGQKRECRQCGKLFEVYSYNANQKFCSKWCAGAYGRSVRYTRPAYKLHPEYSVWCGIKRRCYNPNEQAYKLYGARGIKMCERWRQSFTTFYSDLGPRPSPQHTIERISSNGDYTPENCKWATRKEQARNRRTNRLIEFQGITLPLCVWAERMNMDQDLVWNRLRDGWSVAEALTIQSGSVINRNRRKLIQ